MKKTVLFVFFLTLIGVWARADLGGNCYVTGGSMNVTGSSPIPVAVSSSIPLTIGNLPAVQISTLPQVSISSLPSITVASGTVNLLAGAQVGIASLPLYASATNTVSASVGLSSVQIIGGNANRHGFTIYNNSANSAYLTFGVSSSSASPTLILATFTQFVFTAPVMYTGPISAIRNSGSGTLNVTEW